MSAEDHDQEQQWDGSTQRSGSWIGSIASLIEEPEPCPKQRNSLDDAVEVVGFGTFHRVGMLILGLGNAADAVELLAVSFVLPSFPDLSGFEKGFLAAAVFVGMLVGGLVCGLLSDHLGRKPTFLMSLGINAVFGGASALAPSFPWLVTARVLSGIGIGGSIPSIFTMSCEYLPPASRGFWLSVVAWFWPLGSIFTAGVAWLVMGHAGLSWRVLVVICSAPATSCFFLTLYWLPETPRFLYNKGRYADLAQSLNWIAKRCGRHGVHFDASSFRGQPDDASPIVVPDEEAGSISDAHVDTHDDQRSHTGSMIEPASSHESVDESVPILEHSVNDCSGRVESHRVQLSSVERLKLLLRPRLRRATILLVIQWFAISFGWYGLILWMPSILEQYLHTSAYMEDFVVALASLVGNSVAAFFIDRVGRKWVLVVTMLCSTVIAIGFAVAKVAWLVVALACAFNAFSIGGWVALDCLSVESFPTESRSSAMGVLAAFGRLGSMSAQFVNGALIDVSIAVLLLVTASFMALGAVTALGLRETANKELVDH